MLGRLRWLGEDRVWLPLGLHQQAAEKWLESEADEGDGDDGECRP